MDGDAAMMFLVVNADDAGLAKTTDDAILKCTANGLVRSASLVVNGPTAEDFVARAADAGLDLGLHVNLTQGLAVAGPQPTLTDAEGRFPGKAEMWRRAAADELDGAAVRREVVAQWERCDALDVRASHVDGHNHVHLFPAVRDVMRELADGLWVRAPLDRSPPDDLPPQLTAWAGALQGPWKRTDHFTGCAFARDPSADVFLSSLDPSARVTEYMVHPGARPGSPFTESPLREREAELLCAGALDRALENRGFLLKSFLEVPCA